MIRLKVISLNKIRKKAVLLLGIIVIILGIFILLYGIKRIFIEDEVLDSFRINIIKKNIILFNVENDIKFSMEKIVEDEFPLLKIAYDNKIIISDKESPENEFKEEKKIELINLSNVDTKIVNEKNKQDVYTDTFGSVKIKNESKYTLSSEMLNADSLALNNTNNIVIYHTHTCESYTPTENSMYEASGNYRTLNLDYSVAGVGDELTNQLALYGFNIIHDKTKHDYPAYNGSYTRSLATILGILNNVNNSTDMVIDLHRDALGNNSDYGPCVMIGDEKVAQIMFVIGTDGGGLDHPIWKENLKLAIKIEEKANEIYPGLFKPIILRNSRYNQHVSNNACIIEVGATGNTIEECKLSMKYLADILNRVIKTP